MSKSPQINPSYVHVLFHMRKPFLTTWNIIVIRHMFHLCSLPTHRQPHPDFGGSEQAPTTLISKSARMGCHPLRLKTGPGKGRTFQGTKDTGKNDCETNQAELRGGGTKSGQLQIRSFYFLC